MEGLLDMERKGFEWIMHDHDRDLWVTMVEWVDILIVTGVTSDVGMLSPYIVISHHRFREWLGAVRQQAIT